LTKKNQKKSNKRLNELKFKTEPILSIQC